MFTPLLFHLFSPSFPSRTKGGSPLCRPNKSSRALHFFYLLSPLVCLLLTISGGLTPLYAKPRITVNISGDGVIINGRAVPKRCPRCGGSAWEQYPRRRTLLAAADRWTPLIEEIGAGS